MELLTERLILREFTLDDFRAISVYYSSPRFADFHGPMRCGAEQFRRLLETFIGWSKEVPRENYQLAVAERTSPSEAIGSCGVRCKGGAEGVAEFGIELAPWCWGKGMAAEAATAILRFGFDDLRLNTIVAKTVTENHRISRLLTRLGFEAVGTCVGADWIRDRGWSQSNWSLSADKWKSAWVG